MAYGEKPSPQLKGLINFAGDLRYTGNQCEASWAYTAGNLKAKLVAFGPFGADAHGFSIGFSSEEMALANCKKNSPEQDCKLYVVNVQMVWVNH
jgi:hypothetical protein